MRIFIIEDDGPTVMLLTIMLEQLGHEVCGSEASEDEAVAAVIALSPDFLIIDNNLRIGTGIGALQQIITNRHIPHVFVSADLTQLKAEIPRAIMLQKPYGVSQMVRAIELASAA
jgi:two-component system, response regulator PdtaR